MADSRRGGIEKIAHLFIAGNGAADVRARDNSPMRWSAPTADKGPMPAGGPGADVRDLPPEQSCQAPPPRSPTTGSGDPALAASATESPGKSDPAACPSPALLAMQSLLMRARVAAVLSGHLGPLAGPAAELFARTLAREGSRLAMLYGPAELACLHQFSAQPLGGDGAGDPPSVAGPDAAEKERGALADALRHAVPCDLLLLPDWVFQFDLWPGTRGIHAICLSYGAGGEGLMSAYGALKGLIARFGKPDELLLLPFGCNEQEEAWVHERLADMCRRFLELEPRLAHPRPDLHVHVGKLLPIEGGSEGVRQLFEATGRPRLTLIPRGPGAAGTVPDRAETRAPDSRFPASRAAQEACNSDNGPAETATGNASPGHRPDQTRSPGSQAAQGAGNGDGHNAPVSSHMENLKSCDQDRAVDTAITRLVPVATMPSDGEAVLPALLETVRPGDGGLFDSWSRHAVAGTIVGREGLIAAAGETPDLLGFALWLCRQAKVSDLDALARITIAVPRLDAWTIEAAEAMPVPVQWVRWRAYALGDQLGLGFEPLSPL